MDIIDKMKTQLKAWSADDFTSLLLKYKGLSSELLMSELFGLTSSTPITDPIPGDYGREELIVGVVNSAIQFGLVQGFSYIELYHFMYLCLDMLTLLAAMSPGQYYRSVLAMFLCNLSSPSPPLPLCMQGTLPALVAGLRGLLDTQGAMFSEASLLRAAEYLTTIMLHHAHLYQYVLCEQRVTDMTILRMDIQTPAPPLPLGTGTIEGEWHRREKLKQLDLTYSKQKEYLRAQQVLDDDGGYKVCSTETRLSEAQLQETISNLAKAHTQRVRVCVIRDIAQHELDLRYQVEKAELLLTEQPPPKSPLAPDHK